MNITAFRFRFIHYLEPVARMVIAAGITPNQVTIVSLLFGIGCAWCYATGAFILGSILLFFSAMSDLLDGSVARQTGKETKFGAVFDWIVDKYIDAMVLLGVGISGIPIISGFLPGFPIADPTIVGFAIIGSLMNTFIKPVTYAEIGFQHRIDGKIDDPLEGVGFFGRPETILVLGFFGIIGYIPIAIIIIAVCTNFSAIQRITYLYQQYS